MPTPPTQAVLTLTLSSVKISSTIVTTHSVKVTNVPTPPHGELPPAAAAGDGPPLDPGDSSADAASGAAPGSASAHTAIN